MNKYNVTKNGEKFGSFYSYNEAYVALLIDARDTATPKGAYSLAVSTK
jgi:hypothetical protein